MSIFRFLLFLLAFITFGTPNSFAQNTVTLVDEQPVVSLKQGFPYFKDKTNAVSFHQARAHFNRHSDYASPVTKMLNFGIDQNLYWFKLSLTNQSNENDWYFSLGQHFKNQNILVKKLHVYDMKGDGQALFTFGEEETPPKTTILTSLDFPIEINQEESKDLLIMAQTMKNLPFKASPSLMTAATYNQHQSKNTLLQSALLSIGIIITSIGFTLFFVFKHRALLFFALYIPTIIASFLLFDGQIGAISAYIPSSILNFVMVTLPGLSAGLSLFLGRDVLNLKSSNKIINYSVILGGIALIIAGFVVAAAPNLPPIAIEANLILPAYASVVLTVLSILGTLHYSSLLIFALGWAVLAISHLTPILTTQQGLFIHIVFLTAYMFSYIKIQALESLKKDDALSKEFDTKIRALKIETETEKKALQRKRESEKNMLQDLRQRDAVRAHELKVAKAEADTANQAKSDFLAMISHEIRTPMTGIMGMVQLTLESELNTQQREYIETVKYSGETLLALLNDILDFSKIESGHMDLESLDFELRRLIKSVAMLMSGRANEQGLDLKIDIADNVPDLLQGDPNRIRQILLNLLSNAIKFTKQGSVTIKITKLNEKNNSANLSFAIVDTGIGISQAAQEKLFGAYQQADESISRRYGGTGLGLNICKMLSEAMGGAIKVTSKEGEGSTFAFNIPLKVIQDSSETGGKSQENNTSDNEKNGIKSLKILSVDDNAINLKVMAGLLEKDGHTVTSLQSAQEALNLINQESFDVILADMRMPEMDGIELARQIRAHNKPEIAQLPVIAVTGNTLQKDIDECFAAGMNDFLSKPPAVDAIRATLEKVINTETSAAPTSAKEEIAPKAEPLPVVEPKAQEVKKEAPLPEVKVTEEIKQPEPTSEPEPLPVSKPSTVEPEPVEDPKPTAPKKPAPTMNAIKEKSLSATAKMAETVMEKMADIQQKEPISKKNKNDSTPPNKEAPIEEKKITKEEKKKMSDDKPKKQDPKKSIEDLKTEATSFYKKAKASVMLGLGNNKTTEEPLDSIILEEEEEDETIDEELLNEYSMDNDFADDIDDEEEEDETSQDDLADEAGQSVDLLNIPMITDLQNSLGEDTINELFADLFIKADEILEVTLESAADDDFDDVGERGHELKGMAANFGLERLAALGDALEKVGMTGNKKRLDFLLPLYAPMLAETKDALKKWQSEQT